MLSPDLVPIIVASLAAVSVLGLLAAVFYSRLDKNAESKKRLSALSTSGSAGVRATRSEDAKRKDIERTLREMEEQQKAQRTTKPTLLIRMRQAGMDWSKSAYFVCCGIVGCGTAVAVWGGSSVGILPALGFGAAAGLLGPHLYVNFMRARRLNNFSKNFPNAIDVIVRGVKSGLPVGDCLRIVSVEAPEPVRSEFKELVEDQTLGLPIDQAVQRLPTRIPLAEARFFAIVISLQSRTGGSLSDALGGLSKVLRERQKMQGKIRAMSSEAKASAGIIGAMPVVVTVLMKMAAPDYIGPLFTTFAGNVILAGCLVWMLVGILVMKQMISFDF